MVWGHGWHQAHRALGASAASTFARVQCATPVAVWRDVVFGEPWLIPSCILAAVIGFSQAHVISKMTTCAHRSYAVVFALFGCMMTSAMFVHSFSNVLPQAANNVFAVLDGGLTSSVAFCFLLAGLVDVGALRDNGRPLKVLRWLGIGAIMAGYTFAVFHQSSALWLFMVLYVGLIVICCPAYAVLQLVYLCRHRVRRGLGWLLLGGVAGAAGLYACLSPRASFFLCSHLGVQLNGNFWWFYLSDVAMLALARYYRRSRTAPGRAAPPPAPLALHVAAVAGAPLQPAYALPTLVLPSVATLSAQKA